MSACQIGLQRRDRDSDRDRARGRRRTLPKDRDAQRWSSADRVASRAKRIEDIR